MIARTAPMGWNSWNTFAKDISEELILQIADVMASEGYGFRQILAHYYTDSVITDISDNYAI